MTTTSKTRRTCPNGHQYHKSSDCPVCPICEKERSVPQQFLSQLAAPARRALEGPGLTTLKKLASWTEAEVLALHGVGLGSVPKLKKALAEEGLTFRKK